MPLKIIRQDIIKMKVDAIVNSAHPSVSIGYGVDSRIHDFAGPLLFEARKKIGNISVSKAFITPGYKLMSKYVIHTVGPNYYRNELTAPKLLRETYQNVLNLARSKNVKSLAFPLISSGVYGYPKKEALEIAKETINLFLKTHEIDVFLVLFDQESYDLGIKYGDKINNYLIQNYDMFANQQRLLEDVFEEEKSNSFSIDALKIRKFSQKSSLKDVFDDAEETFSDMLFRLIRERNIHEVKMYQDAHISKQLFSKIKSNSYYQPTRETVFLFCVAMHLSLSLSKKLLASAGFTFNKSSRFDLILMYFIENKIFDFYIIDSILMQYNQKALRRYS
jgi:O-acetyl-ADP-ribose deacetylase (regulator of RNase III)